MKCTTFIILGDIYCVNIVRVAFTTSLLFFGKKYIVLVVQVFFMLACNKTESIKFESLVNSN